MKSKNITDFISTPTSAPGGIKVKHATTTVQRRSVDGFLNTPTKAHAVAKTKRTSTAAVPKPAAPISILTPVAHQPHKQPKPVRHIAVHVAPHAPEGTTTLVRAAVKKPGEGFKKQAHTQSSLTHKVPGLVIYKPVASTIDTDRLARAQQVERSPHIARHAAPASTNVPITLSPLAVQPVPVKPEEEGPTDAPAPQPSNKPADIFEHALANAGNFVDLHAHRKHYKKKARRHALTMVTGTLALLLVAGFVAYQNSPALQIKIASLRSGVSAHTPDFKATGFSYNGASGSDGKLLVGLSAADGQYAVIQQPTSWDSTDMIQNIGATDATGSPTYSTLQAGNIPVYRLGNNSATWISNGKWYQVSGTNSLSDSQVTALVKNL